MEVSGQLQAATAIPPGMCVCVCVCVYYQSKNTF